MSWSHTENLGIIQCFLGIKYAFNVLFTSLKKYYTSKKIMLVKAAGYSLMGVPTVKKKNKTVGSPAPIRPGVLGGRRAGVGGGGGPGGGGTAIALERNSEKVWLAGLLDSRPRGRGSTSSVATNPSLSRQSNDVV